MWKGRVEKGDEPNTVRVWVEDEWGWRATFIGIKDGSGYALTGELGETPPSLKLGDLDPRN